MSFSAGDVKNLREKTGAGMMACKEALSATNGDLEAAVDYLRKKGLAAANKKQSRVAAEGAIATKVSGGTAVLLEVNCETDFVSKGDDFQNFAKSMAELAFTKKLSSIEQLREIAQASVNDITLKCGEKIDLRRLVRLETQGELGFYNHGGRIGVLVEAQASTKGNAQVAELLKDISMHVAASAPRFLRADEIDESFKKREADIYTAQLEAEGKAANMIPKIVEGKLKKLSSEVCLLEQKFVKNPDVSINQHVAEVSKSTGIKVEVKGFKMFVLGEGIEKKADNLAEEVAKMAGKQ
jgi:elongation factor Ts